MSAPLSLRMTGPTARELAMAKDILKRAGYVVVREKSYRQAQERQRVAEALKVDAQERAASQDKWWRTEILPELFQYRDRVTFLYGAARAAGCTAEELAGSMTVSHAEAQHLEDQ